jgi:N-succinyldiaminopimelate aminotransferase
LRLGDDYFQRFQADLQAKRDLLAGQLAKAGFTVLVPQGTYFITTDIRPLGFEDGIGFCLGLPERAGVVAVPSAVFYQDRRDGLPLVRFCFAKADQLLLDAGQRLIDSLSG